MPLAKRAKPAAKPAATPPDAGVRSWLKTLNDYADPILKALLVVGVFLGGYEYLHRQQQIRVEQSLALVDEWETGGYRDAYQRINDLVWPLYAESAGMIEAASGNQAQVELIFGNLGDGITGRDNAFTSPADRDADQIFYYFDRAALCANERICDFDVINTFLGEDARTFWLYFSRYAERRQGAGYSTYGTWTERFAKGEISRSLWGQI